MTDDARFRWIVATMAVRPRDRILEIGPGSSASIACLASALNGGHYVGIDRSATAIDRATKRHAALVASGRVRLVRAGLEELSAGSVVGGIDFGAASFDKVLAINVNLFWTRSPAAELAVIRELLVPGGTLTLCYGYGGPEAAPAGPKPPGDKLTRYLAASGFTARTVGAGDLFGVVATAE
ncbi:class I SAM-dependent methyltransferase [Nocardia sp. NPDC050435]|uniref:class I SAM-dependent methyltransferase n=1 Tax=Nocardia sp. NPDC050435 TaxID=3155040 RepID=UPI0033E667F6